MNRATIPGVVLTGVLLLVAVPGHVSAQDCPDGALAGPKGNALYLVYSDTDDASFPSYGDAPTSPLPEFDISELDASIGTEADLQDRVQELTEAAYCEFDVEVKTTTTLPTSPPEPRWQIVGLGTDDDGDPDDILVGKAQEVDTGDADGQDYARFWGQALAEWTGSELTGADSTLERWATALTNLVAHESGHNYGGDHDHGVAVTGEDPTPNHFMTNPWLGATPDSIVDSLNHFSDSTYEVLGHNIGLNVKTLHNWDFTNPNDESADSLTITILSNSPSLDIAWSYGGVLSPWDAPTVVATGATQTFQGDSYGVHELRFTTPKSWSGGADGEAPPGEKFHVGASFTGSDPLVIYETTLHKDGSDLPLKPRMFDYDAGTAGDGSFSATFTNPDPGAGFLVLEDVQVFFVPRMIDIETMIEGVQPRGMHGNPVEAFHVVDPLNQSEDRKDAGAIAVGEQPVELDLASLIDPRHIDITYNPADCPNQQDSFAGAQAPGFGDPSPEYCQNGTALSLFPATYTYVTARVVHPDAEQWDPQTQRFIEGPLESRLFFQVAGTVPDFNENGVDDLLDIRTGDSLDVNENGVPDEAEDDDQGQVRRAEGAEPMPGPGVALVAMGLLVTVHLVRRQHKHGNT